MLDNPETIYIRVGVCANIYYEVLSCVEVEQLIEPYFIWWEEFSGDISYPVADPKGILSPIWYYRPYEIDGRWEGEQADARLRLIMHLIKCINKDLKI